ncbi:MAG: RnfABCDGE type electron transport complex subunit G [Cytophagaceae bacterium]|jgi:electron transport complex protein RnfG|nr:RnfABCDGE type electron transport complex subunit G [Cytophagaceae bacterium]
MSKSASTLPNMVITLLLITVAAGTGLGFVYKLTKEPIAIAKLQKQQNAIKDVVPEFDNDPSAEVYEMISDEGFTLKIFPAKKDGEIVGAAIETMSNSGFSGDVKIMVGMKPDGTIINYSVLEHKETPGLGTKMADWFKNEKGNRSIIGKNPATSNMTVSKDGGDVDAITAATISSRAFLQAVRTACAAYVQNGDVDSESTATTKTNNKEGGEQ